jgi:hypothetical protein
MTIFKTKNYSATLAFILIFVIGISAGSFVFAELQTFSGMEGRSYHSWMYESGNCAACHTGGDVSGYPEDGTCLQCHAMDDVVAATMPEDEAERWQNPHDSLHYGRDVPCSECHGEHSNKEHLCADCHNFDYPNHQF